MNGLDFVTTATDKSGLMMFPGMSMRSRSRPTPATLQQLVKKQAPTSGGFEQTPFVEEI
jgi:hypothetical protein